MGVYQEALNNKILAAKLLIPLIEFEFGFGGLDSPELTQSPIHAEQMKIIFNVCKKHNWTTQNQINVKSGNLYFRLTKKGFKEIFELAGPFVDNKNNEWSKLILERMGNIGGYRKGLAKTEDKVLEILKNEKEWLSVKQMCLKLRLLPSVIREAIRKINYSKKLKQKRIGKTIFWKI